MEQGSESQFIWMRQRYLDEIQDNHKSHVYNCVPELPTGNFREKFSLAFTDFEKILVQHETRNMAIFQIKYFFVLFGPLTNNTNIREILVKKILV